MSSSALERRIAKLEKRAGVDGPLGFVLINPTPEEFAAARSAREQARKAQPNRLTVWVCIGTRRCKRR